jgi:hypothetical protein
VCCFHLTCHLKFSAAYTTEQEPVVAGLGATTTALLPRDGRRLRPPQLQQQHAELGRRRAEDLLRRVVSLLLLRAAVLLGFFRRRRPGRDGEVELHPLLLRAVVARHRELQVEEGRVVLAHRRGYGGRALVAGRRAST